MEPRKGHCVESDRGAHDAHEREVPASRGERVEEAQDLRRRRHPRDEEASAKEAARD